MLRILQFLVLLSTLFLSINFRFINCYRPPRYNPFLKKTLNVPIRSNLYNYLDVINRVAKFFDKNPSEVDMNVYFGLFLTNVNLRRALIKERRHLSGSGRNLIKEIVTTNDGMIKFFQRRAKQDYSDISDADKLILNLFANETKWIQRLVSFGFSKLKGHTTDEIEYMLSTWPIYVSKIDSVDQDVPSPEKSDECLASLGNMSLHSRTSTKCTINRSCEEVLKNGTNYGYALTHRLMFMSMARFSHGCSVFSPAEDQYLTNRFCSMLYVEAESIEKHNFANGLIDLMLEIIALCGLHGHEQFLSGPWLQRLKRFQVSAGCFGFIMNDANYMIRQQKPRKWKLNRSRDHDIMDGHCNSHATTLAMCAYAEAVRFILEMYY